MNIEKVPYFSQAAQGQQAEGGYTEAVAADGEEEECSAAGGSSQA